MLREHGSRSSTKVRDIPRHPVWMTSPKGISVTRGIPGSGRSLGMFGIADSRGIEGSRNFFRIHASRALIHEAGSIF